MLRSSNGAALSNVSIDGGAFSGAQKLSQLVATGGSATVSGLLNGVLVVHSGSTLYAVENVAERGLYLSQTAAAAQASASGATAISFASTGCSLYTDLASTYSGTSERVSTCGANGQGCCGLWRTKGYSCAQIDQAVGAAKCSHLSKCGFCPDSSGAYGLTAVQRLALLDATYTAAAQTLSYSGASLRKLQRCKLPPTTSSRDASAKCPAMYALLGAGTSSSDAGRTATANSVSGTTASIVCSASARGGVALLALNAAGATVKTEVLAPPGTAAFGVVCAGAAADDGYGYFWHGQTPAVASGEIQLPLGGGNGNKAAARPRPGLGAPAGGSLAVACLAPPPPPPARVGVGADTTVDFVVREDGHSTVLMALSTAPRFNVTVQFLEQPGFCTVGGALSPHCNRSQLRMEPPLVVFTPENWASTQAVIMHGVHDGIYENPLLAAFAVHDKVRTSADRLLVHGQLSTTMPRVTPTMLLSLTSSPLLAKDGSDGLSLTEYGALLTASGLGGAAPNGVGAAATMTAFDANLDGFFSQTELMSTAQSLVATANVNEVQTVSTSAGADDLSGQLKLTFGGQTTASIAFDASHTDVQTALNDLSTVSGAVVSRDTKTAQHGYVYTITFDGATNRGPLAELVCAKTGTGSTLGGTSPACAAAEVRAGVAGQSAAAISVLQALLRDQMQLNVSTVVRSYDCDYDGVHNAGWKATLFETSCPVGYSGNKSSTVSGATEGCADVDECTQWKPLYYAVGSAAHSTNGGCRSACANVAGGYGCAACPGVAAAAPRSGARDSVWSTSSLATEPVGTNMRYSEGSAASQVPAAVYDCVNVSYLAYANVARFLTLSLCLPRVAPTAMPTQRTDTCHLLDLLR